MSQRLPRLGDPIVYRPRVAYGRQSELAGQITRVWDAETGDVDLVAFPVGSEVMHFQHVARSEGGQVHRWSYDEDPALAAMRQELADIQADLDVLRSGGTLTPRRGPGRPRKIENAA